MTTPLYEYQKIGVTQMERFLSAGGGTLLADETGLGKTIQTLSIMARQKNGPSFPALVICPVSVKFVWEAQAMLHAGLRSVIIGGQQPGQDPDISFQSHRNERLIYIINPDILWHHMAWIRKIGIKFLVVDECHHFINPKARRTKALMSLARGVSQRVALSATPMLNRPAELWTTLNVLRPDAFPGFISFAERYCGPRRGRWGMEYKGATHLDELHNLLMDTCMVRRLKKDHLPGLPKLLRCVLPIPLSDPDEYAQARDNFLAWVLKNYGPTQRTTAMRAEAVVQIGYLLRLAARLKARAMVDHINQFLADNPREKVTLFAVHRKMIELLTRRINTRSVVIDGSVTGPRRKQAVDAFVRDPGIGAIIGNIKAMGSGVDGLQSVCSTAYFTELFWRPGDHIQAEGRLDRIGQPYPVTAFYCVAGGTIEDRLCQIIQRKAQIIHGALDGSDNYSDTTDIYDQLINMEMSA